MLVIALGTALAVAGASDVGLNTPLTAPHGIARVCSGLDDGWAGTPSVLPGKPATLHEALQVLDAQPNHCRPDVAQSTVRVGIDSLVLNGERTHQVHYEQRLGAATWQRWSYTLDARYAVVGFESHTGHLSDYRGHTAPVEGFALPASVTTQLQQWTRELHACSTYVYDYPRLERADVHTAFGEVTGYRIDLVQVVDPDVGQMLHIVHELDAAGQVRDTRCIR